MFSRLVDTTSVESVVSGTNELFVGCPLALKTGFHSSSKTYLRFLACSQFAKCSALVENSSYECSNLSEKSQVTEPGHPPPQVPPHIGFTNGFCLFCRRGAIRGNERRTQVVTTLRNIASPRSAAQTSCHWMLLSATQTKTFLTVACVNLLPSSSFMVHTVDVISTR